MSDIIVVKNLKKQFGHFVAVNNISFSVKRGEIFAFLGPNGAGKSTTIKMLTTMLRPTSGELKLAGHDVTKERDNARQAFGIVFQDPSLDEELTAYENLELHATLYGVKRSKQRERIEQLMTLVDLWERRDSKVKTYSGGMRRRLEIARGLIHEPKVLFLDEPTLGLDTQTRNTMWQYIKRLSDEKDMTIFFTTHYLEEAQNIAEKIAIIDHGQIVGLGSVPELTKQTHTKSLEETYLSLTGTTIRDDVDESNNGLNARLARRNRRLR